MMNRTACRVGGAGGYVGRLALVTVAVAGAACASGGGGPAMTAAEARPS